MIFIQYWKIRSSQIYKLVNVFETRPQISWSTILWGIKTGHSIMTCRVWFYHILCAAEPWVKHGTHKTHPISQPSRQAMGCALWILWRKSTILKWGLTALATTEFTTHWKVYHCIITVLEKVGHSGLVLGLRPANERQRYFVTPSLIGWVQA